jgi:hypothetical protein
VPVSFCAATSALTDADDPCNMIFMMFEQDFQVLTIKTRRNWNEKLAARMKPGDALFLWLGIVALGSVTGWMMYGLNGWLSPIYLLQVWAQPGDVWAQLLSRFMVQGAVVGATGGALLGALLLFYALICSRLACPAPLIACVLPKMVLAVWVGWAAMGINTVILFWCAPDLAVFDYARVVRDHTPMASHVLLTCQYVWNIGSPIGALLGAVSALIIGCSTFKRAWQKHLKQTAT